jgi:hypothetical protein
MSILFYYVYNKKNRTETSQSILLPQSLIQFSLCSLFAVIASFRAVGGREAHIHLHQVHYLIVYHSNRRALRF